jgi:hypothetical protein
MMQYIRISLTGFALLFLLSCSTKEFITVGSDEPVFSARFTFDGTSNVLTAGIESFLFTNFHRSDDSVTVYSGTFADPVCFGANLGNCKKQMSFLLRGNIQSVEPEKAEFSLDNFQYSALYFGLDSTSGTPILNLDNLNFGTVAIHWTDANGVLWKSDLLPQIDSKFNVSAIETYLANDRGQNTIKMDVTFKCLMYNSDFVSKTLEGTAVIAVGTP